MCVRGTFHAWRWLPSEALRCREARCRSDGGEEDLKMERTVVTLVIKRLHTKDRVLLSVREPDKAAGETQGDRLLVVHPQHEL